MEISSDHDFSRQERIFDPERSQGEAASAHIIGLGATGSCVGIALAKMGVSSIDGYDPDRLEEANFPNQYYPLGEVGNLKTHALARVVESFAPWCRVIAHSRRVAGLPSCPSSVWFCCVDTLESRRKIWDSYGSPLAHRQLYVDMRIAGEYASVYIMHAGRSAGNIRRYEKSLEGEALDQPCGAKMIIYMPMMLGALAAYIYKRWAILASEGRNSDFPLHFSFSMENIFGLLTEERHVAAATARVANDRDLFGSIDYREQDREDTDRRFERQ